MMAIRYAMAVSVGLFLLAAAPESGRAVTAEGGTETEVDGWHIHTFTSSGWLNVSRGGAVEALIVAGGGGGGGYYGADWD